MAAKLEDLLHAAAKRGNLTHLSLSSTAHRKDSEGWEARVSSLAGSVTAEHKDPAVALANALKEAR